MQVTLADDGAIVDAHDLGPLLGLAPADVPEKMRAGDITSQSEAGAGEDEGYVRLTFWYAGKRVRLICDATGLVVKTSRSTASNRSRDAGV